MKHQITYDILNKTEYETLMIIWALSRTGHRIHACKIAYDVLGMSLQEADTYTRQLRELNEFSLAESQPKG